MVPSISNIFQWVIKDNRSKNKQNVHSSSEFGLKISFNISSNRIASNRPKLNEKNPNDSMRFRCFFIFILLSIYRAANHQSDSISLLSSYCCRRCCPFFASNNCGILFKNIDTKQILLCLHDTQIPIFTMSIWMFWFQWPFQHKVPFKLPNPYSRCIHLNEAPKNSKPRTFFILHKQCQMIQIKLINIMNIEFLWAKRALISQMIVWSLMRKHWNPVKIRWYIWIIIIIFNSNFDLCSDFETKLRSKRTWQWHQIELWTKAQTLNEIRGCMLIFCGFIWILLNYPYFSSLIDWISSAWMNQYMCIVMRSVQASAQLILEAPTTHQFSDLTDILLLLKSAMNFISWMLSIFDLSYMRVIILGGGGMDRRGILWNFKIK